MLKKIPVAVLFVMTIPHAFGYDQNATESKHTTQLAHTVLLC